MNKEECNNLKKILKYIDMEVTVNNMENIVGI